MKKKIILPVFAILSIALILVGTSYAYWKFTYISDKNNIGKSKCLSIELTNQKNEISLNNTYPISDIEAKKLTPYSFTINNTCDTFISYDVNLEMLEGTTMNSKYMAVMINNEHKELLSNLDNANTIMSSSVESRKLVSGSLGVGDSVDYTLRLWMDESVTLSDDAQNKTFTSKIVVNAQPSNYSPKDVGYDTLHDAILVNEYQTTPEKAIEKINAKGEPDLSQIAPVSENDLSDKGLYKSIDDFGDTYYYRGNVKNNNVYFAGFYWQIIRINGDGSIRLLYNGTEKNAKGEANSIGKSKYSDKVNSAAYIGYMYGNPDGKTIDELNKNINNSTIKTYIDNWYENNILGTEYEEKISDSGFCNYRGFTSGNGVTGTTYYNGGRQSNLTCGSSSNDLFTVTNSVVGNHSLNYSIGLITCMELELSGLKIGIDDNNVANKLSWTYSSFSYYTMTPALYDGNMPNVVSYKFTSRGFIQQLYSAFDNDTVRPVISLKADVKISGGIGTSNAPYVVDTNN